MGREAPIEDLRVGLASAAIKGAALDLAAIINIHRFQQHVEPILRNESFHIAYLGVRSEFVTDEASHFLHSATNLHRYDPLQYSL